ncbi:MAG: pilus assembly protein, partial [Desulfobacterales bacterium]
MATNLTTVSPGETDVQNLKSEVAYRANLQEICNKIYAARNLDDIFINLMDEITALFEAERVTVYMVDGKNRELFSRFKSGDEIDEFRVAVSNKSIAGYAAFKQTLVNIKDVQDDAELRAIDSELKFDKSWDEKTGFKTRQVLAYPIIFQK